MKIDNVVKLAAKAGLTGGLVVGLITAAMA